jgi:hypothetical protein
MQYKAHFCEKVIYWMVVGRISEVHEEDEQPWNGFNGVGAVNPGVHLDHGVFRQLEPLKGLEELLVL